MTDYSEPVSWWIDTFTLEEMLSFAYECDNNLALAIHQTMLSQSSRPQSIEERIFDEGYEAGWNDCIMKASNAIDNLGENEDE